MGVANIITESLDVLECLHKALPYKHQAKPVYVGAGFGFDGDSAIELGRKEAQALAGQDVRGRGNGSNGWRAPTPQEKAAALWKNLQHLDFNKFLLCAVSNQIEDYLFGRLGQALADAARASGRSHGYGLGPVL